MIIVAVVIAAWIVVSVPLSLGVGWLVRHGRPAEAPRTPVTRQPRRPATLRQLLH